MAKRVSPAVTDLPQGGEAAGAEPRRGWGWRAGAGGLVVVGVLCAVWVGRSARVGGTAWAVAAVIGLVTGGAVALPGVRRLVGPVVERVRRPSRRARGITAVVLSLVGAYYLLETATGAGRAFRPVLHDEHCYLIQTQMAARGRLWMPRHELGEHFESFHLITDRVYAAKYGPGTAMLCAPAVWLGVPPGMACLAMAGASVGLMYLVLCRTVDGLAAGAGAVMVPAVGSVRRVSIEALSQAPMMFLTLLAFWAFLHWREGRRRAWLAVAWAAAGWGVITRPVEGAGLVLALGVGMGVTWWRSRRRLVGSATEAEVSGAAVASGRRAWAWEAGVAVLALVPFGVVQLVYDRGVTGEWLTLPWSYWAARHDPYDTLSVAATPPGVPHESPSVVPRMRTYSEAVTRPQYEAKVAMSAGRRLVERGLLPVLKGGLPSTVLLVLVPVALLGLWRGGRWVLVPVVVLFLLVYARHTYFIAHYVTSVTPALIVMVWVGWDVVARLWGRAGELAVRVGGAAAILAATVAALPQVRGDAAAEEWDFAPVLRLVDERIGQGVAGPAVVLFRAEAGVVNPHIEPTYNVDVAWPDDAEVVRAHDLGPERNRRVFAYYARRAREGLEGERRAYLYDLSPARLGEGPKYLGMVGELAGK